jgi:hypothetical protein
MFMRPRPENAPPLPAVGGISRAVIVASAAVILLFGVFPNPVVRFTQGSGTLNVRTPSNTANTTPVR